MNPDLWTWHVILMGGTRLSEDQVGTIGNVPAALVEELHLIHRSGEGHVAVNLMSGRANVNGAIVEPAVPELASKPKVPLFFRRRGLVCKAGKKPETITQFRAIGYVIFEGGKAYHVSAMRVFDAAIDRTWYTTWPDTTARHVANTGMLIGG